MQSVIPQTGAGGNKCSFWGMGMFSCQQWYLTSQQEMGWPHRSETCPLFRIGPKPCWLHFHHIWQNRKPKLSLYFNLHLGRQACQGVSIDEALCCCPGGSSGTPFCPKQVKNPKARFSLLSPGLIAVILPPLFPSLLPFCTLQTRNGTISFSSWQGEAGQSRAESSVRNPKTVGFVSASICRQCTMLIPLWVSSKSPSPRLSDHALSACLQVSLL